MNDAACSAPQGQPIVAQGNALGFGTPPYLKSPEGATSGLTWSPALRPWRAPSGLCGSFRDRFPGRCPGLRWGAPSVLRKRKRRPAVGVAARSETCAEQCSGRGAFSPHGRTSLNKNAASSAPHGPPFVAQRNALGAVHCVTGSQGVARAASMRLWCSSIRRDPCLNGRLWVASLDGCRA